MFSVNRHCSTVYVFLWVSVYTEGHKGIKIRAYLQVLKMLGGVIVVVAVVVVWVILSYNIMDMNVPSIRPPHCHIIAQVDVSSAVKLIPLFSKLKLLHPQSSQHLQDMKHFFYKVSALD